MKRLSRRGFLLTLLGLTAAAAGGLQLCDARRRRHPALAIADLVRDRLSHLDLERQDLERFGHDFLARCGPGKRHQVERLTAARPAAGGSGLAARKLEREIFASFLCGSDFFDRPGEPAAASYVAFPDPYELGCANPLARLGGASAGSGNA